MLLTDEQEKLLQQANDIIVYHHSHQPADVKMQMEEHETYFSVFDENNINRIINDYCKYHTLHVHIYGKIGNVCNVMRSYELIERMIDFIPSSDEKTLFTLINRKNASIIKHKVEIHGSCFYAYNAFGKKKLQCHHDIVISNPQRMTKGCVVDMDYKTVTNAKYYCNMTVYDSKCVIKSNGKKKYMYTADRRIYEYICNLRDGEIFVLRLKYRR